MASKKTNAAGILGTISIIIASVFALEGGFSNHPEDSGGATMYGITEKVARQNGYTGPMEDLPKEEATRIYEKVYIYDPKFHLVVELSPAVGHKLIDAGVNTGQTRQVLSLQMALNALNGNRTPNIREDGLIGPATITAVKDLQSRYGEHRACTLLIKLIDAQQATYYMSLKHLKTFTVGWVDKRVGNVSCEDEY